MSSENIQVHRATSTAIRREKKLLHNYVTSFVEEEEEERAARRAPDVRVSSCLKGPNPGRVWLMPEFRFLLFVSRLAAFAAPRVFNRESILYRVISTHSVSYLATK